MYNDLYKEDTAMVQLIVGKKGKGKTKYLLEKVNSEIKEAEGNFVYLDKSSKHMYELNNKIRLIDVSAFPLKNSDEFVGFVCGVISQDHDLEKMFLDSFIKLSHLDDDPEKTADCIQQLKDISKKFDVDFVLSVSLDKEELSSDLYDDILISL